MKYTLALIFLLLSLHQANAATRHLTSARACQWADEQHTAIDCIVKFRETGNNEFPFTARADDQEAYGRDIWQRAIRGDFGNIAEYL